MKSTLFATSRLRVRHLQPEDFEPFHEMQGNQRVMQYTTGVAATAEEDRADLQRVIGYYNDPNNTFWVWAIESIPGGEFVGTCALIRNPQGENEIGYRLLERFWGNGYGREITDGLIDYALGERQLDHLVAYVNCENLASVRILEQSRFRFVREFYNEEERCMNRYYRIERS